MAVLLAVIIDADLNENRFLIICLNQSELQVISSKPGDYLQHTLGPLRASYRHQG